MRCRACLCRSTPAIQAAPSAPRGTSRKALRVFTQAFGSAPGRLLAVGRARSVAARWSCWSVRLPLGRDQRQRAARQPGARRHAERSARLQPAVLRCRQSKLNCFFRDDTLSDLHRLHLRDLAWRRCRAQSRQRARAARASATRTRRITPCSSRSMARMRGSITPSTATTSCARCTPASPTIRSSS